MLAQESLDDLDRNILLSRVLIVILAVTIAIGQIAPFYIGRQLARTPGSALAATRRRRGGSRQSAIARSKSANWLYMSQFADLSLGHEGSTDGLTAPPSESA